MKNLSAILVLTACLVLGACSSDKGDGPGGMELEFDRYGVAKWDNPEDFLVRRYYTLVDTFTVKQPDISVIVKILDTETATGVRWWIEGEWYESSHVDEISNAANGLTIRTFYPKFEDVYEYGDNTRITAYVTVGSHKIERTGTVTELKVECDIFGADFGADSLTVRSMLEETFGVSRFHMRDAETGVDLISPHFLNSGSGRTLYFFPAENNYTLAEVAEFPSMIFFTGGDDGRARSDGDLWRLSDEFLALLEKLDCPYDIRLDDDGSLAGDKYSWRRDRIEYHIKTRDDVFPNTPLPPDEAGNGRYLRSGSDVSEGPQEDYLRNSIGIFYKPVAGAVE